MTHLARFLVLSLAAALAAGCEAPPAPLVEPELAKAPAGPTVTAADPNSAVRDTTLVVQVLGSGFDTGSTADFLLDGLPDANVVTRSTQFVSSSRLDATVTITAAAMPAFRDVAVTTSGGKKGIGTAKFQVLEPIAIHIPGATGVSPWDVNSSGLVIGNYATAASGCSSVGFAWTEVGGAVSLPTPPGYCRAYPDRVNENGVIAGAVYPPSPSTAWAIAVWSPAGIGTWSVDVLPSPAGVEARVVKAVGADGAVVASWSDGQSRVWRGSTWTVLASLGGTTCQAFGGSESLRLAGSCAGATVPAEWADPGAPATALPLGSARTGRAEGVNNAGIVVGQVVVPVKGNQTNAVVAIWQPNGAGGWTLIQPGITGIARDINDDGVVIGVDKGRAFLWSQSGGEVLLPVPTAGTVSARAISARGTSGITWIAGYFTPSGAPTANTGLVWKR